MIEHVEKITRKIEALEKIHDLMADALEDISLEMALLRKELEVQVQPPLPGIEAPAAAPADYPRSDNFCICGHAETEHAGPTRGCAHIRECDCEHFILANKAGA